MSSLDTHTLLQEFSILQNTPDSLERSQRLEYLETQLHILNLQQRTKNTISKMSSMFLETNQTVRRMECFLESQVKHALITAPTQVGKTSAVLNFIKECIARNIGVIVSSDNKTDQQEQIMERLRSGLALAHCELIKAKISDKKFIKQLKFAFKSKLTPIIFCLDNASQIIKIHKNISYLVDTIDSRHIPKTFCIVHDEGDVVTRGQDTYHNLKAAAKSHKAWVDLIHVLQQRRFNMKRVFVSATPENCVFKYQINSAYIIRLEIPNNYTSYNQIEWRNIPTHPDVLLNVLQQHINENTTTQNFSSILYLTDRKINNHQQSLRQFTPLIGNFLIHTYNSNGIVFKIPQHTDFVTKIKNATNIISETSETITIKLGINKFYQIVKECNIHTVITIGMDMIARGISFVSEKVEENTMAANIMIYNPSNKLHAVAINQTIGRLTGTARPDLKRILYSTKDVYNNYIAYNLNQKQYMTELLSNEDGVSSDRMKEIIFDKKLSRDLDRKKLKLEPNYKSDDSLESSDTDTNEVIDGVKISNIEKWMNPECTLEVAKMIRFLLKCPNYECPKTEFLKTFTEASFRNCSSISSAKHTGSGKVFTNSQIVKFNPKIIDKILLHT